MATKQEFAARTMQFGFERAMAGPLGGRQGVVQGPQRAIDVAGAGFGLGKRNPNEPVEDQGVLLAQAFDPSTHILKRAAGRDALVSARQALEKDPKRLPQQQIVLAREPGKFGCVRRGARQVAAHQREQGRVHSSVCACADMSEARDSRLGVVDQGNRPLDAAQRP
jgi:hypothetical protein